ncbi:MAG: bacteriophage holin [Candidatus Colwellbacteria bacterium]|nr:bacteriophage holin [Candidatus Colwellbacteria bacterium]
MNLNPKAFGLSSGILWGLGMFVMTILAAMNGYASDFLIVMSGIYPGFSLTYFGAFLGAIYGFVDGFVGGWIFAWLYNRFLKG